eukprot:1907611-Rhodomonas_salina.2
MRRVCVTKREAGQEGEGESGPRFSLASARARAGSYFCSGSPASVRPHTSRRNSQPPSQTRCSTAHH